MGGLQLAVILILFVMVLGINGITILEAKLRPLHSEEDCLINTTHGQDEKRRFRFGMVEVEGAKTFTPEQIIRISRIKTGSLVKTGDIDKAMQLIKDAYLSRGFIHAEVSISEESKPPLPKAKEGLIDLRITIHEGESFFIRRIEFIGNTTTRHRIVQRATGLHLNDPYNPARLDKAIQGLNRLGRFELVTKEDVTVEINEQGHFVDLLFHLKEKRK